MSLTFKLLSLVVRTAAKPIGNYIKRQAKEHDGFRRFAINQAQRVHRIDMRLRLGLLHDAEAQQRMHDREKKAAEERKKKTEVPTVRTEEEQRKYLEQLAKDEQAEKDGKKKEEKTPKVKIRPLSDARAIELGANFFSEAFIFAVAVGLLLAENYRSSRKASNRRDEVAERLSDLEVEVERLKKEHDLPELEALNERIKKSKEARASWWNPLNWFRSSDPDTPDEGEEVRSQQAKDSGTTSSLGQAPRVTSDNVAQKPTSVTTTSKSKEEEEEKAHGAPRVDSVKAAQKQR